jgi:hypothetical protein
MLCGSAQYDSGSFYNAEILVCPTPLFQLTANYNDNYSGNTPQSVFASETLNLHWTNNEWCGFVFNTAFSYNGTDNLIFEFRWQGDDNGSVYVKGWYPPGGYRVLDGFSLTSLTGTIRDYMNSIRIYFTPLAIKENPVSQLDRGFLISSQPNPFQEQTTISYQLPKSSQVTITLYNSSGDLVNTLIDQKQEKGFHSVNWNGKDKLGQELGGGMFFCRLKTEYYTMTKRIISLK